MGAFSPFSRSPSLLIAAVASLLLLGPEQYVSAHSYLECTDLRADGCYGFPRNYQFTNKEGEGYAYVQAPDAPACSAKTQPLLSPIQGSYKDFPMAKAKAGSPLTLQWQANNHEPANLPGRSVMINYIPKPTQTEDPPQSEFNKHKVATLPFGATKEGSKVVTVCNSDPEPNKVCKGTFQLPSNMQPGVYTFQWWWEFNSNYEKKGYPEVYTSCFEVEILGADGKPYAAPPKVPPHGPKHQQAMWQQGQAGKQIANQDKQPEADGYQVQEGGKDDLSYAPPKQNIADGTEDGYGTTSDNAVEQLAQQQSAQQVATQQAAGQGEGQQYKQQHPSAGQTAVQQQEQQQAAQQQAAQQASQLNHSAEVREEDGDCDDEKTEEEAIPILGQTSSESQDPLATPKRDAVTPDDYVHEKADSTMPAAPEEITSHYAAGESSELPINDAEAADYEKDDEEDYDNLDSKSEFEDELERVEQKEHAAAAAPAQAVEQAQPAFPAGVGIMPEQSAALDTMPSESEGVAQQESMAAGSDWSTQAGLTGGPVAADGYLEPTDAFQDPVVGAPAAPQPGNLRGSAEPCKANLEGRSNDQEMEKLKQTFTSFMADLAKLYKSYFPDGQMPTF